MQQSLDQSFTIQQRSSTQNGKYKIVGSNNQERLRFIQLLNVETYDHKGKPLEHKHAYREVNLKKNNPIKNSMIDIPVQDAKNVMHIQTCNAVILLLTQEEMNNKQLESKLQIGLSNSQVLWNNEGSDRKQRNEIRQILKCYANLLNQQIKHKSYKLPKLVLASFYDFNEQHQNNQYNKKRLRIIISYIKSVLKEDSQNNISHKLGQIIIDKIKEWKLGNLEKDLNIENSALVLQLIREQLFQSNFQLKEVQHAQEQYKTGIIVPAPSNIDSHEGIQIKYGQKQYRKSSNRRQQNQDYECCCKCIIF